jgi:hypothetical protein
MDHGMLVVRARQESLDATLSNLDCDIPIRIVAGFAEVAGRKEILVAEACNHPNCLVLPLALKLVGCAA